MAAPVFINDPNCVNFPGVADLGTGFTDGVRVGNFQQDGYMGGAPGALDLPINGIDILPQGYSAQSVFGPLTGITSGIVLYPTAQPPYTTFSPDPIGHFQRSVQFDCSRSVIVQSYAVGAEVVLRVWGVDTWGHLVTEDITLPTGDNDTESNKTFLWIICAQAQTTTTGTFSMGGGGKFGLPWYYPGTGYEVAASWNNVWLNNTPYADTLANSVPTWGSANTQPIIYPCLMNPGDTTSPATATSEDPRGFIGLYGVVSPSYPLTPTPPAIAIPAPNGSTRLTFLYYLAGSANTGNTGTVTSLMKQTQEANIGVTQFSLPLPF